MAVDDLQRLVRRRAAKAFAEQGAFWCLFAILAAYTLSTMDGGDIAPLLVSGALLLLAAVYLALFPSEGLRRNIPVLCLFAMACYGVAQTLWFPQRIVYDGWSSVLFWLSAATITLLSAQLVAPGRKARQFRFWFVLFGSVVCLLDLLEQASHTNKYYWLIASRYATVSGPFAYWNNFSQFVELLLPVTLWMAVSRDRPVIPYLVLSGLQIGAVVASGSRAGSALVIVEFVAVMVIAYTRNRNRTFLVAAGSALALSLLFTYAAGLDMLSHKLQQRDQLAVRRDIDASSLAMIRAQPWTGWGLGTYVPVYRMFARYDDGTYVNRAHNDWLEWTAEGGVFFSAMMLIVFVWSIRPAVRSIWGIGVIAVCLHAMVDYPFGRLGVCGWYFALIGMLVTSHSARQPSEAAQRRAGASRGGVPVSAS